jgi:hypothetical protein
MRFIARANHWGIAEVRMLHLESAHCGQTSTTYHLPPLEMQCLGLSKGKDVLVVIKASNVMLALE